MMHKLLGINRLTARRFRWSRKMTSMVLKNLMRHSSVATTEKYDVGIQADETAAVLAVLMTPEGNTKRESDVLGDTYEKRVPEKLGNP